MKIILNFLPLKTGGGVQVALDFLKQAELYGGAARVVSGSSYRYTF